MGLHKNNFLSFRTPLFNEGVKNNILRDLEGEILWGLFLCIQKTLLQGGGTKSFSGEEGIKPPLAYNKRAVCQRHERTQREVVRMG